MSPEPDLLANREALIKHNRAEAPSDIDPKDKGTPDEWVPRHRAQVRLTGRHPFNVEPPLPDLMAQGFITPASLHYVRNHGAVPKREWATHTLAVDGLVASPTTFSMDDLLALPAREIPVTLVCAGNRRKEENLVKQTIGFNWGAAGVSTSVCFAKPLPCPTSLCRPTAPPSGARGGRGERPRCHPSAATPTGPSRGAERSPNNSQGACRRLFSRRAAPARPPQTSHLRPAARRAAASSLPGRLVGRLPRLPSPRRWPASPLPSLSSWRDPRARCSLLPPTSPISSPAPWQVWKGVLVRDVLLK